MSPSFFSLICIFSHLSRELAAARSRIRPRRWPGGRWGPGRGRPWGRRWPSSPPRWATSPTARRRPRRTRPRIYKQACGGEKVITGNIINNKAIHSSMWQQEGKIWVCTDFRTFNPADQQEREDCSGSIFTLLTFSWITRYVHPMRDEKQILREKFVDTWVHAIRKNARLY